MYREMSARRPAKKRNRSASSLRDRVRRRRGNQENPIVVDDDSEDTEPASLARQTTAPARDPNQRQNSLSARGMTPGYDPRSPAYGPETSSDPNRPRYSVQIERARTPDVLAQRGMTPGYIPLYYPPSSMPSAPAVGSSMAAPSMPPSANQRGILILGKQVGSGAYGSVVNSIYYEPNTSNSRITNYVGEDLQPRKHYAVKIQDIEETKIEMNILRKLGNSPYIMKVYGTGNIPGQTDKNALVSDMYTQTLGDRIKKESIETRRRNFSALTCQMFEAVAVLASKNIMHRDLHSGNIMFGSDPYASPKIIDFGWSVDTRGRAIVPFEDDIISDDSPYRIFHPPEQRVFVRHGIYQYGQCTTKFDVYSMALNLVELVYDSSKNQIHRRVPDDFNVLMICALLRIPLRASERAYGRFSDFDHTDMQMRMTGTRLYPDARRIMNCVHLEVTNGALCSYFVQSRAYVKLCLSMPRHIGLVLKSCLQIEGSRPTAAQAVQQLRGPTLSSGVQFRF